MFKDTIQIVQYFIVRVANDLKTQGPQMPFTLPVLYALGLCSVNVAINFNHECFFRTIEIDDERTDGMLPTKLECVTLF